MKQRLLFVCVLLVIGCAPARAQQGGHTVFGDLRVDDSKAAGLKPETFQLVLYNGNLQEVARERVSNGGRYRFLGLGNGEYDIAVQIGNDEVARVHLHLMEPQKTEIRKDIELQWKAERQLPTFKALGTVPAGGCEHTAANQELFDKALENLSSKNYDSAITLLNRIVAADPKDCVAWTELGTAQFRKGTLEEAEKSYQQALKLRSSFLPALVNLGKLRLVRKNFEGAIEALTQAIKEQPLSAEAQFLAGEAYLQIKKGSVAVGYLNEALRLDPIGKAEAHLRLAALYKGAGLKDRAVAEYEQFLAKKPDYPDREALLRYINANKKP